MRLRLLHTNDLHGSLTPELLPKLVEASEWADLYFDTGDAVKAGNLAVVVRPEAVWPMLAEAGCAASVIGNRETHVLESAMLAKLNGASHTVLCANVHRRDGSELLPSSVVFEAQDLKVGVFGVSVPIVTKRMKTQAASQLLWEQPIEVAACCVKELREKVDVLIALTHIGLTQDRRLAEAYPQIDLILGGHSHDVLHEPEVIAGVPILQTGSHARFFGRYVWDSVDGLVQSELVPWKNAS